MLLTPRAFGGQANDVKNAYPMAGCVYPLQINTPKRWYNPDGPAPYNKRLLDFRKVSCLLEGSVNRIEFIPQLVSACSVRQPELLLDLPPWIALKGAHDNRGCPCGYLFKRSGVVEGRDARFIVLKKITPPIRSLLTCGAAPAHHKWGSHRREEMLWIETQGSWLEMGRQYGEELRKPLKKGLHHYARWLVEDPDAYAPALEELAPLLQAHCGSLLQETKGMAEGSGIPEAVMLGYRFFNEVRRRMPEGCSAVFLAEAKEGPLLGRNCDLEPDVSHDIQVCRTCRPEGGSATITTTYVGMGSGPGLNEHGLGFGGASAHTDARYGNAGLPGAVLCHLLLHECRDVTDARALMAKHAFLGKPANILVGDESGASVLFEFAPGRPPVQSPRRPDRNWQACTNFFVSGEVPIQPDPEYLQSAYARYGRIVHQLGEGLMEHSVAGLQQLLTEIAQPGLCRTEDPKCRTAYSEVNDLRARRMYVSPGHPADAAYEEVCL